MKFGLYLVAFFQCCAVYASPFSIDFPEKMDLTHADYEEVQAQLRAIEIRPIIDRLHKELDGHAFVAEVDDFYRRCTKGVHQKLIDLEKGLYPRKELIKIGKGGNRCVVCCGPLSGKYPYYIDTMIKGLREVKFDGYFLYYIGGWPNPTGKEIKYVGVPYSFKIFAMLEAKQLGFDSVLWLDAACYPMRSLTPLFDHIDQYGALLNHWKAKEKVSGHIFPATQSLLKELTGTDVLTANYINTIVFGLKMNTPEAEELVRQYYQCAELGTPFLSCFPEEWVLTAIIGEKQFDGWRSSKIGKLVDRSWMNKDDTPKELEMARGRKGYFYQRKGR